MNPRALLAVALLVVSPVVLHAQDEAPTPATAEVARPTDAPPPEKSGSLSQLPAESLVKHDEAGKVVLLREPVEWAALRRTPSITAEEWKNVELAIRARRAECELIALRNLDIVEGIESGSLNRVNGDVRQAIKAMTEATRPLRPEGGELCIKLGKDGLLTMAQAQAARRIASEYNSALGDEAKKAMGRTGAGSEAISLAGIRRLRLLPIEETLWSYRFLVDEASRSLDRALAAVKWPDKAAPDIEAHRAAWAAGTESTRPKLVRELLSALTVEQRRALLAAVIAVRESP